MRDQMLNKTRPEVFRIVGVVMLALGLMLTTGCNELERDDGDGRAFNGIPLPTDIMLNLSCADMGINDEQCVLQDMDNIFRATVIGEFDANNPDAAIGKFTLNDDIPKGPQGAKARVYFWATALARRQSGENQWYTAQALHTLYGFNDDPLIKEQALRAYRSVLDNFFESVIFFVAFSTPLKEVVPGNLSGGGDFPPLVTGQDAVKIQLAEWGYSFQNGVVTINGG